MAELDLSTELQQLRKTLGDIRQVIDLPKLEIEIAELKERAGAQAGDLLARSDGGRAGDSRLR